MFGSVVNKVINGFFVDILEWIFFVEEINLIVIVSVEYLGGEGEFSGLFFVCFVGEKINKIWLDFKLF